MFCFIQIVCFKLILVLKLINNKNNNKYQNLIPEVLIRQRAKFMQKFTELKIKILDLKSVRLKNYGASNFGAYNCGILHFGP